MDLPEYAETNRISVGGGKIKSLKGLWEIPYALFLIASMKIFHIDSFFISRVEGNPLKDQIVTNP
jgi:hypothetical protein